jgi:Tol biopolymer transport system component
MAIVILFTGGLAIAHAATTTAGLSGSIRVRHPQATNQSAAVFLPLVAGPALPLSGGLIVFEDTGNGGENDLYLITTDGHRRYPLTDTPESEYEADWSPDGRQVAFIRYARLFARSIVSGDEIDIETENFPAYGQLAWSPDGQRIAFDTFGIGGNDIAVTLVRGGATRYIVNRPKIGDSALSWAPNSTRFVFGNEFGELIIANIQGTVNEELTGVEEPAFNPDWSRDGRLILYQRRTSAEFDPDYQSDLYLIPAEGGQSTLLVRDGRDGSWSPDGRQIVFGRKGGGIYRINADGSGLMLLDGSPTALRPVWRP